MADKTNPADNCDNKSSEETQIGQVGGAVGSTTNPPDMPPTAPDQNQSGNNPKSQRDCVKSWFEIAGILAGVIGVWFLVLQYNEMVKNTKATLKSIEVSQGQMNVMRQQLSNTRLQQRAWLKIGDLTVKRMPRDAPDNYSLECSYTIKNAGFSPAIELGHNKIFIRENTWRNNGTRGFTRHEKWTPDKTKNPTPIKAGDLVMPGETLTNIFKTENMFIGDNLYVECWVSFRDVYFQPYVIGCAGLYDFKKDSFDIEFWDQRQIPETDQTNSTPTKSF